MKLKLELVVTLLVANIVLTRGIGKATCKFTMNVKGLKWELYAGLKLYPGPDERQCGDIMCGPNEFCQVLFPPCRPPPEDSTTDSPHCPPILVCEKIQCPMEEPPPTQLLCIKGYEPKLLKLPKCEFEIPSCVPENCGQDSTRGWS